MCQSYFPKNLSTFHSITFYSNFIYILIVAEKREKVENLLETLGLLDISDVKYLFVNIFCGTV